MIALKANLNGRCAIKKKDNSSFVKNYLCVTENAQVNFDMATIGKAVEAFVRSKAIRLGSFVAYEEDGKIVKEDPRTGQKTIIKTTQKK